MKEQKYTVLAKVWKYKGKAGWFFLTLPKPISKKIRERHGRDEEGWGRLKAKAKAGNTSWMTAIWFDSKQKSYLLPLKSEVRRKEKIEIGDTIKVELSLVSSPKYFS